MKYRIATISECEALTDLRMRMRKELDSDFNSELIYAETLNYAMTYAKEHGIGKVMLNPSQMGKSLYENYGFRLLPGEYAFYLN